MTRLRWFEESGLWRRASAADLRPMAVGQRSLCRYAMGIALTLCIVGGRDRALEFSAATAGIVLGLMMEKSPSKPLRWALGTAIAVAAIGLIVSPGLAPWLLTAALAAWISTITCDLKRTSHAARSIAPTLVGIGYTLTNTEVLWVTALCASAMAAALWAAAWSSEISPAFNKGRHAAGRMVAIAALAMPLGLAMFVLFPRVPLGFNEQSGADALGTTGLSTTMTPGSVSELVQSDRQMFQASFNVETLDRTQMYWRAMVLDRFDGTTWTAVQKVPIAGKPGVAEPFARSGRAIGYTIELPSAMGKMVPLLDITQMHGVTLTSANSSDVSLLPTPSGIFYNLRFEGSHTSVTASALPEQIKKAWSPPEPQDTLLPAKENPRARALAEQWATETGGDAQAIVLRFKKMVQEGPFRYTLHPPKWGSDGMDQFLFTAQAGFCEHYASTLVFLMRATGVPARVVIGFQGGDVDGRNVRILARDAHAWAEVWMGERGWARIDPTGFIDPSRVEEGTRQTLSRGLGWLSRFGIWTQEINGHWNQRIVEYNQEQQQDLWNELKAHPVASALKLLSAIATTVALRAATRRALSAWRWRRTAPGQRLLIAFGMVISRLKKDGLAVSALATPAEIRAVVDRWPKGRATKKLALQGWLIRYERARYGQPGGAEVLDVARWARRWRGLRSF